MPRTSRWILLGRALPRRTRERIFEPAFYDLLRRSLRNRAGTLRLGGHAIGIFAGSWGIAVRRALLTRRVAIVATILIVLVTTVVLLGEWFGHIYDQTASYSWHAGAMGHTLRRS